MTLEQRELLGGLLKAISRIERKSQPRPRPFARCKSRGPIALIRG